MLKEKEVQTFEDIYIKVRRAEQRIYEPGEISKLPVVPRDHVHHGEWKLRRESLNELLKYLKFRSHLSRIMDLGCGNGWLTAAIAETFPRKSIHGVDLNHFELDQARSVFEFPNLNYTYLDIFKPVPHAGEYDMVLIVSTIQYFPHLDKLIDRLMEILSENGEIHILDSPLYASDQNTLARERSEEYYRQLGYPEMMQNYFHHKKETLFKYNPDILYDPPRGLEKMFTRRRNPFPWFRIRKKVIA